MTPNDLDALLAPLPADAALVFETHQGPIGAGYHVTEWKLAQVHSIDCGANQRTFTEATLQLLDGQGRNHMKLDTFRGILRKSLDAVPGLGQSPLRVEFAHGNAGLQLLTLAAPALRDGAVVLPLETTSAICKPMTQALQSSCCGGPSPQTQTSCC